MCTNFIKENIANYLWFIRHVQTQSGMDGYFSKARRINAFCIFCDSLAYGVGFCRYLNQSGDTINNILGEPIEK